MVDHSHYFTFIAQMQFLAVKEVIKGEIQPLDQLPHCHDVDGIVKVCMRMHVVHAFNMLCIYTYMYIRVWLRSSRVRVCV